MLIYNESKNRSIELSVVDSVKEYYCSYKLNLSIETENIKSNFNNFIWISEEDLEKFLLGLKNLENTKRGQTQLQSMSPGELSLRFKAIDNSGHLAVELHVKKDGLISIDYSYDVSIEFQVDPTILPSVIVDFQKIKL